MVPYDYAASAVVIVSLIYAIAILYDLLYILVSMQVCRYKCMHGTYSYSSVLVKT